jgi:hypothetical protein
MDFNELTNEQRRQLIDARAVFQSWQAARRDLAAMGTMRWQSSKGRRYLYQAHGSVRKCLGVQSPGTETRKADHDGAHANLRDRAKTLSKRLDKMAPVNRALALGRLPTIAARVIRELDKEGLLGTHIIVVGTNALFAYEAMAGVVLGSDAVSTDDADLLWDTRNELALAVTGIRKDGIMGLLRRVDHSFRANYGFNATNRDNYIVDLICPEDVTLTAAGKRMAASDREAVPMAGADWLVAAPRFQDVVMGADGWPVRMVCPDIRTFALHKLWLSRRQDRQPVKRPRDAEQARIVASIVTTYQNSPLTKTAMPWLSAELKALVPELKRSIA